MQFKTRNTRFNCYRNTKHIPTEVAQNNALVAALIFYLLLFLVLLLVVLSLINQFLVKKKVVSILNITY